MDAPRTAAVGRAAPGHVVGIVVAAALLISGCGTLPKNVRYHDPLNAEEHARLGASYDAQGMSEAAVRQYEAAVRLDPRMLSGWMALGNLAYEAKDYKTAEGHYRKVLKISPHHAGASNNIAMVRLGQRKGYKEAEALLSDALMRNTPLRSYLLDTLANIYVRQKRFQEAEVAIREARKALPPGANPLKQKIDETAKQLASAATVSGHTR